MSVVDVAFLIEGASIPLDHGYMLLGALSEVVPGLHGGGEAIGVLPIFGRRKGAELLIAPGKSRLSLRVRDDLVEGVARSLAGKEIRVGSSTVKVAHEHEVRPLRPAPDVRAQFVTIKGFHATDAAFSEALSRHMAETIGKPALMELERRRVMTIHGRTIVGYGVKVRGLSDKDSVILQAVGIGGRRSCGAGIFIPLNPAGSDDSIARRKAMLGVE